MVWMSHQNSLKVREQVGYLPESVPLYTEMTVERFLSFAAQAKGMGARQIKTSIDKTLDDCGLEKVRGRIIGHLSKGFKQRVGLAQALLNNPPVLILDEPTIGLDPAQVVEIRADDPVFGPGEDHYFKFPYFARSQPDLSEGDHYQPGPDCGHRYGLQPDGSDSDLTENPFNHPGTSGRSA